MSLKIAFVSPYYDSRDIRRGSGTFFYMSRELERQGCELSYFGPVAFREPTVVRPLRAFAKRVQKGRYLTYLDPAVARALGKELSSQLGGSSFDVVLTNDPGVAAGLDVPFPIVYYSDVMLPASARASDLREMVAYRQVPLWALRRYQKTMRRCLERSALAVFPAEWQVELARGYGVAPEKLHLVYFGANIPDPGPEVAEQRDFNLNAQQRKLNLLFVGKDWEGKGGSVAVEIATELNNRGIKSHLHIVGVDFSDRIKADFIHFYGLLNKDVQSERNQLEALYRSCDVLVVPSKAEGYGLVFVEAAAYGLPSLAYDTTGVKTSVKNRTSGILLNPEANPKDFSEVILDWFNNPCYYRNLSEGARQFYETNANWAVSVRKLIEVLKSIFKSVSE